jgi:hypothetical protein
MEDLIDSESSRNSERDSGNIEYRVRSFKPLNLLAFGPNPEWADGSFKDGPEKIWSLQGH